MIKYIACLVFVAFATVAEGQQEKPMAKPQATERTAPQKSVRDEKKSKDEAQQRGSSDPTSTIQGRQGFQREESSPEVIEKQTKMDEQRMKEEKEHAMRQRQEAMQRGGQSADSRQRLEEATRSIDRSTLDKETMKDRHSAAQAEAKAAIDRLTLQCDDLQERIVQIKAEISEGIASGLTDEDLKESYMRIERLGSLLNVAQKELYFLSYAASVKTPKADSSETPQKH